VRSPNETLGEHLTIIDAICHRDPQAAEAMMRLHFKRSIAHLTEMAGANHAVTHKIGFDNERIPQQRERRKSATR
jgi:hypothetical protein